MNKVNSVPFSFHFTAPSTCVFLFTGQKEKKANEDRRGSQRGEHLMTHISTEKETAHNQHRLSCCWHVGV